MSLCSEIILNQGLSYNDFMLKVCTMLCNYFKIDKTCCMVASHDLWKYYITEKGDPVVLSSNLQTVLDTYKNKKFNLPRDTKYWCMSEHMPTLKICKGRDKKEAVKKAAKAILKRTGSAYNIINFSIMQVSDLPIEYFCTLRTYEITLEEASEDDNVYYLKSFIKRIK